MEGHADLREVGGPELDPLVSVDALQELEQ